MDIGPLSLPVSVPVERRLANAREALARNLPLFLELERVRWGRIDECAIVAGGPSSLDYIDEIKKFKTVIACGSVHDHLITIGIIPTYSVIFDPSPEHARFYKKPKPGVCYLVATTCDPEVFKALDGYDVNIWHPYDAEFPDDFYGDTARIGGGSTVTLRAIALAHVMGFREFNLYGFDCCLQKGIEKIYTDEAKPPLVVSWEGHVFQTTPALLQQAQEFMRMYNDHMHVMAARVRGDGLIATIMKTARVENYRTYD